ncbi:MAG: rod-binding protein [Proteobacteria bacterium]|nr:rod-binding protein [Pseudomonadota bacterium]
MTIAPITSPTLSSPAAPDSANQQGLVKTKAAAKEFEAVFLSQMMSHMFEGIGTDPVFGGGEGEDMFRGMMVQEYGKQMAKSQSIGISDQLQKMMLQMQQR